MTNTAMSTAANHPYDAIVVGGGIHGVMVCLELVRRQKRPLLIERGDFGGATTANSSCIVHGGLRYLQHLDIPRTRASFLEQQWFIQTFPDFVKPLGCLMPLYGRGLRRPSVFRAAMAAYELLTRVGGTGGDEQNRLPGGQILSTTATRDAAPALVPERLEGGALWYDARVQDMLLLIRHIVRWACNAGAIALEQVEAVSLDTVDGRVAGIEARDMQSGETVHFIAPVVWNTAGPWATEVSARFGDKRNELATGLLGWNLLLETEPLSEFAIAAHASGQNTDALFFQTWPEGLHVGTRYTAWNGSLERPEPNDRLIAEMIRDANSALPTLGATQHHVKRVYAGLLPADDPTATQPSKRPRLINHGRTHGPQGLYSYSGVKFTTARYEAERMVRLVFADATPQPYSEFRSMIPTEYPTTASAVDDPTSKQVVRTP